MKPIYIVAVLVALGAGVWWMMRRKSPVIPSMPLGAPKVSVAKITQAPVAVSAPPPPPAPAPKKEHSGSKSFYERFLKPFDPTRKENVVAGLVDKATGGWFSNLSSIAGSIGRIAA